MEEWDGILSQYSEPNNMKALENAIHMAKDMLAHDLAPFEIDLFLESLLMKPVALLETVSTQLAEQAWFKLLVKAFALLSDIVEKFPNAEPYYDNIERLCNLWYPASVRAKPLSCLSHLARRHRPCEATVRAQEQVLSMDDTCKAVRVELLGVLCEHHPELFPDVTTLWRTLVNILDSHIRNAKISLNVVKEVLFAVSRLFKNFGTDLVVREVYEFYEQMKVFINVPKCHEACCVILENYSGLFKEKVSADVKLRSLLWDSLSNTSRPAVIAVYRTCFEDGTHLREIIKELVSKSSSGHPLIKFTALRVLSEARGGGHVALDLREHLDVQRLERLLRDGAARDHMEAISWSIRANVLNSDRLLQAAILYYDALPAAARHETVIRNILEAPAYIRTPAIIFLTTETCTARDNEQRDLFMSIWRSLLDSRGGADVTVLDHSRNVLEDYLQHATFLLETFLEDAAEELPPKLSALLNLTAYVLNTQDVGGDVVTSNALVRVVLSYAQTHACAATVRVARAVAGQGADMAGFYQLIDINSCGDDDHLLQSCCALQEAPDGAVDCRQVLLAVKVLFSRSDTVPTELSMALKTLESLILNRKEELNKLLLHEVIILIEQMRELNCLSSKDHRILHRDAVMFLGKFGFNASYNKMYSCEKVLTSRLKELCLSIPSEGATLKLDLRCALQYAAIAQDPDALQTLLTLMCANSRDPSEPVAGAALCHAIAALSRRSTVAGRAASLCGHRGAHRLLDYVVRETSPHARSVLLGAVGGWLASGSQGQVAQLAEDLVTTAAGQENISQTKLDLLATVINAMKENNILSQKYLARVLILVLETQLPTSHKVFNDASQLLMNKISLFVDGELASLIHDVVDSLCKGDIEMNANGKKIVAAAVTLLKKLYDLKKEDLPDVMGVFERGAQVPRPRGLHVLSGLKRVFECDLPFCRELVTRRHSFFRELFDLTLCDNFVLDAFLNFISTFSDILLEVHYEKTLNKLSELIENFAPEQIIYAHKSLSSCLDAVKKYLKSVPRVLHKSLGAWLRGPSINRITQSLIASDEGACSSVAEALKYMVDIFEVATTSSYDIRPSASEWLRQIRAIGSDDMSERDARCLGDLVQVCLMVLSPEGVQRIICGDDNEDTLMFCRRYISAFSKFFTNKPFILLKDSWSQLAVILNDVVRYTATRRQDDLKNILELVDELWPSYETRSDMKQKYSLLLELSCRSPKLSAQSRPMQWVVRMLTAATTGEEDTIRLVALVAGGEAYRSAYAVFASAWPARLSELRALSACALQALLDNCARTRDHALLALLARLAAGDSAKGWWDEAFDDCMKDVASGAQMDLLEHMYRLSWGGRTMGACERLLIPLLRYISPSLCEEFFSVFLEDLFSVLKKEPREGASSTVRQSCITDYTGAFNILRIAFEKIPKQHIESPSSVLYSRMKSKCERPFLLAYNVCVRGAQLRAGSGAGDAALTHTYRMFHCAVYNCMAAALCCRCPKPEIYGAVFDVAVWKSLVDENIEYRLPITEDWKQHTTRQAVSIDISEGVHTTLSAGTPSRTVHFLRTLSEDPFLYDIPEAENTTATQELRLVHNPLNQHECAATLTALFCHVAAMENLSWMKVLRSALDRDPAVPNRNVRWLLAQVICNCKQELKPHAAALRCKLLALVADTETNTLNALHMEIINTLFHWREEVATDVDRNHLNKIVRSLVGMARSHVSQRGLVAALLDKLNKIVEMYGSCVTVAGDCCDAASNEFYNVDNQLGLKILKIFAKNKVDLKDVAEQLFAAHQTLDSASATTVGKALGLAASTLTPQHTMALVPRFQQLAERLRKSGSLQQYVKLVYYTQKEWPDCCDSRIIRDIADLANKIPGSEKQRCLDIVANYLSHAPPGEHIDALFDTLDVSQLLTAGQGLNVVEKGLPLMQDSLRRRVTLQLAADGRTCAPRTQLLAALEVALSSSAPAEPHSKKRRMKSAILSRELRPVVSSVSLALTSDAVGRVAALLDSDHAMRFCEAFALAVYYPVTSGRTDLDECAHRTLELFLQHVRLQDGFQSFRLREEPLDYEFMGAAQPTSTKLSTKGSTTAGQLISDDATCEPPLDVRVPLDDVLTSILRFAKRHPSVATELCVQVCRSSRSPVADEIMCSFLGDLVRKQASPLVLQLCRLYVDGCCALPGFPEAVQELVSSGRGCEQYGLAVALHQEVRLKCAGPQLFVMGSDTHNQDIKMPEVKNRFSIDDLVACFGTLAHWEELGVRERTDLSNGIPVLWTDEGTFQGSLSMYEAGEDWFGTMVSMYCNTERSHACCRRLSRADRWPRNKFDVSAMAEAMEWRYIRDVLHAETDLHKLTTNMGREDCLAKWAARLMLRRLFLNTLKVESDPEAPDKERSLKRHLSLSHQLQWCKRANEMALPALALQCLEDVSGLYESETLQWMVQKMTALRTLGLQRDDRDKLQEALQLYELAAQFREASSPEDVLSVEHCRLLLLRDMAVISPENISSVCDQLQQRERLDALQLSDEFRPTLDSMFAIVMACLYENCNDDLSLLIDMSNIVGVYVGLRLGRRAAGFADMIVQRVSECDVTNLPLDVEEAVLRAFSVMRDDLDEFALEVIRKNKHLFRNAASCEELFVADESLVQAKLMLSLVADPGYCLLQYCGSLLHAAQARDKLSWAQSFARMRVKIFENPYAGPDYQVLTQYKRTLYDIEEYDEKSESTRQELLKQLVKELRGPERRTLSLPQLCPALCAGTRTQDRALRRLLRLPADATVQFDETVYVYTESIRRAALVTVCGRGGGARRYIVKSGEALRSDAAARRFHCALDAGPGYWVTPLSDDCGLIEYLEGHETVRGLIVKSSDANGRCPFTELKVFVVHLVIGVLSSAVATTVSTADSIQYRVAAVEQFQKNCSKVPANLLRCAMEQNCLSVNDFICKKAKFTDSLCTITVVNWLLGVGDRHLENVLYGYRDGALCNIDWGAVGQHGRVELPCVRLTRNLLAACDLHVLESRLQGAVRGVREDRAMLEAVLHVSFGWMENFEEKMVHVRGLLQGTALLHQVTAEVLGRSSVKFNDQYIELLEQVFQDIDSKPVYSVQEQVSCLLRQSTDPRILSVTRSKWEPWL